MSYFRGILKRGEEGRAVGKYTEIFIRKIIENRELVCPKGCQVICDFKRKVMLKPLLEKLTCTTILLQIKNFSSNIVAFTRNPPWIRLVDSRGSSYEEQKICAFCENFAQARYEPTIQTHGIHELLDGTVVRFLLFFPQIPPRAKASRLLVETRVWSDHMRTSLSRGDIFDIEIVEKSIIQKVTSMTEPRIRQYRLSQDLSQLPRIRIGVSRKMEQRLENKFRKILIQRLGKVPYDAMTKFRFESEDFRFLPYDEVLRTIKTLAEDIITCEEAKLPPPRLALPKPGYKRPKHSWLIEDRKIFSENELLMESYCEECSNYGILRYTEGLYLCKTCRESLRVSRAPLLD